MPALITHHLFGEHASKELPAGLVENPEELLAFILGNQGPDPLFFRWRTPNVPDAFASSHIAHVMHVERMSEFFASLRDGVGRLPAADASIGRAFALGMLGHYALDREAHPFVFASEYGIIDADPSLADAKGEVHAIIEGSIDTAMLLRERNATVLDCPPAGELAATPRILLVAGALISNAVMQVWGEDIGASHYGTCVHDMRRFYELAEPEGSWLSRSLGHVETLMRPHSQIMSMTHVVTRTDDFPIMNDAHLPWENPFSAGEVSHDSFHDRFDAAVAGYGALAEGFCEGRDLGFLTGHVNYSGRVLGEDERWAGED